MMAESIKGMESLMNKLNALGGSSIEALRLGVEKTTIAARDSAVRNAPAGKGSQADSSGSRSLKGSIQQETKLKGNAIEGKVYTKAPHAAFVCFGTGPVGAANHAGISPNVSVSYTTRKSWVYPTVIDGEETFRTTSGQPARPYLYPAAVEHKDTFPRLIRKELKKAIARIAK